MLCKDQAPAFKGGALCPIGLFAKACVRMHAPGGKLYAIGRGRSEPCFAVAFRRMARVWSDRAVRGPNADSRTESGYPDLSRNKRGSAYPRKLRHSNSRTQYELAIICFLKAWGPGTFDPDIRVRHVAATWIIYLLRRLLCRPEPQSRAASRRHRTAP